MEQAVGTRIAALRKRMAERGMDAYLIPTADFHGSLSMWMAILRRVSL